RSRPFFALNRRHRNRVNCQPACFLLLSRRNVMVCRYDGRHLRMIVLVALVAMGFALPVAAQNLVVGKVTDVKGAPIEGAIVTIEQPSSGRKYETKTGKDGT